VFFAIAVFGFMDILDHRHGIGGSRMSFRAKSTAIGRSLKAINPTAFFDTLARLTNVTAVHRDLPFSLFQDERHANAVPACKLLRPGFALSFCPFTVGVTGIRGPTALVGPLS
jgi:hypothetical protein